MKFADTDADGYYLVEFTHEPCYECQQSHQLIVEGNHLNPVKRAPKWYNRSDLFGKHLVNHTVHTTVTMNPISEDNQLLPCGCLRKIASEREAMKIRKEDDDYIMEDIIRRKARLKTLTVKDLII